MSRESKYVRLSDEELVRETEIRLREMRDLLLEIRDSLKAAGGVE